MTDICPKCGMDAMYFNTVEFECPYCDYIGDGRNVIDNNQMPLSSGKKCPSCGSNKVELIEYDSKKQGHWIQCDSCGKYWNDND